MTTADRMFLALRDETRTHPIGNGDVSQLFELADAIAAAVAAGNGVGREDVVAARARAALNAHLASTHNLRRAITCVHASVEQLIR